MAKLDTKLLYKTSCMWDKEPTNIVFNFFSLSIFNLGNWLSKYNQSLKILDYWWFSIKENVYIDFRLKLFLLTFLLRAMHKWEKYDSQIKRIQKKVIVNGNTNCKV